MHPDVSEILVTKDQILTRVKELGTEISGDYKEKKLLIVSILKGSFIFISDLSRAISLDVGIDFMVVKSYIETDSTGVVRILHDTSIDMQGLDVLIVDDILDSGRTLSYVMSVLRGCKPKSIELCVLLDKPSRRVVDVGARYTGFAIPDVFVVGYGLDYCEKYRNLPYVGTLKPEIYKSGGRTGFTTKASIFSTEKE